MHNQDHGHSGSLGTIPQNFWDSAKINMPDTPTRTAEGIHIHPLDSLNRETGARRFVTVFNFHLVSN